MMRFGSHKILYRQNYRERYTTEVGTFFSRPVTKAIERYSADAVEMMSENVAQTLKSRHIHRKSIFFIVWYRLFWLNWFFKAVQTFDIDIGKLVVWKAT